MLNSHVLNELPVLSTASREEYIAGMRKLCAGVTLITCDNGEQRAGMTATAVCSVSADPPTLLVCINKSTSMIETLDSANTFAVNVLRDSQANLANDFSTSLYGEERFSTARWQTGESGAPILPQANVNFECRIIERLDMATHQVIFGRVLVVRKGAVDEGSLLYCDGAYGGFRSN